MFWLGFLYHSRMINSKTIKMSYFSKLKDWALSWFDIFFQNVQHSPLQSEIWKLWRRLCDSSPLVFLHTCRRGPAPPSPPGPPEAGNTSITETSYFSAKINYWEKLPPLALHSYKLRQNIEKNFLFKELGWS